MLRTLILVIFLLIPLASANVIINEIMYNPTCYSDKYCEWIELYNDGINSVNISNWILSDNTANDTLEGFDKNQGEIIPGFGYALIVDTDTRIYKDFNIDNNVIWIYTEDDTIGGSKLGNSETITIYDNNLNQVNQVTYNNPVSEGDTYSLINLTWENTPPTPGKDNELNTSTILNYSDISISEFLPNPEGKDSEGEWVELYNKGSSAIDLLGFELYDNYGSESDIIVSNTSTLSGTTIQPNSCLVVYTNGVSSFLNNNGFEKITLKDIYNNVLDEVTYSDSDEAVSWSLSENKWQKTTPTPGYANLDNSASTKSEIKIEEIYDLGTDKKAEWGDIIRVKFFVSKGKTSKEVVWIWIENDIERITKKSKFNIYDKFSNYTFTYPLMIPENCDKDFLDGNYKIMASGLDTTEEKVLEIRDSPLCKNSKESTRIKNLEYGIKDSPPFVVLNQPFTTEISLKNNQEEDISLDLWSYPYSGKKKYVKSDEKENLESLTIKPSEEKTIKLSNIINETNKGELNFKVKIQRLDRKTPYELKEKVQVVTPQIIEKMSKSEPSKTLKNPITGYTIYESTNTKAKRSAVFFLNGCFILLLIYLIKNGIKN
jgi:hypothetical protein